LLNDEFVPRLGIEQNYLDWRKVTQDVFDKLEEDFVQMAEVLCAAWQRVTHYLEKESNMICALSNPHDALLSTATFI
jgi:hypothetical protein